MFTDSRTSSRIVNINLPYVLGSDPFQRSKAVMCRTVCSDCRRIHLAEALFIQGIFLLSRRVHCTLVFSSLAQLYSYIWTVDPHFEAKA